MTNSKTCYFSIRDHKSTGTDGNPRGHSEPRNSLFFHQLKRSNGVKLGYTLSPCNYPYVPAKRPGAIWSPCVLWLKSSFSVRPRSSRAFVDIDQGIDLGMA